MKKLILSIILLLTVAFFSPQKVNAQTDSECFREYQNKEYKCLQKFNDCTNLCTSLGSVEAYKFCADKCFAQDKTCSGQASTDLTACKAAIPKNKEEIASEDKSAQDCRKIFDKESYKCLGVSGDCQRKCGEETKRPDGGAYFNSGEVYSKCTKASDCDGKGRACNEQALANFRACQDARKAGQDSQQKDKPKEEEFSLIKFFGVNPFETWLRVKSFGEAGEGVTRAMDGLFFASSSIDIDYEEGMTRVEVDDTSMFGADLTMRASGQIDGVQIKLPGKQDYNDLQPHQKIPDDAIIRISTPSRFYIGEDDEDFEVRSVSEGDPLEFQVKKSKENASVDLIELQSTNKMSVNLGRVLDKKIDTPSITPEVIKKAWGLPTEKDTLVDVPGTDNVKIYSWSTDSGAVIKSSDWQQTEIKKSAGSGGDFITREVQFKQKDVEVKVRNESVPKVRFGVKSPDFLEAVSSRTHYLVSYDEDTKQNTVVVYEGKVEVKTNDGKTIIVEPKDGKPGMVVVTKGVSVVKTTAAGLVVAAVAGGIIWLIRRKSLQKVSKKK